VAEHDVALEEKIKTLNELRGSEENKQPA